MSTSEYRSVDAEGELPISEAELAALANQLFAASFRPGNDSPPQTAQPAPRGNVPDTTAAASYASPAVPGSPVAPPVILTEAPNVTLPPPSSPGPEPIPPQTVPAGPRGNAPGVTAPPHLGDFAVPAGIVPTVPGVLAGTRVTAPVAPRGSAPAWPTGVPVVPEIPVGAPTPTGDEANYYFASPAPALPEPVPHLPDRHGIFDVNAIRADFPILRETVNGKPLIWFDNAATTQKPQAVIDRLAYFYAHENSNIHRAAHELAARATDAYEEARDTVRRFIGAAKSEQIIFVRGTTEAINLVAYSWGGKHLGPGDEIVITHLEHHANIVPWQIISQKTGAILKVAPVDDAGNLLLSEFEDLLGPRTKLVAATQVSNALGTVTPVHKIVELGHRYGARVLIDGAQSIPHIPIDVGQTGADFFVFSGHKIFGPTGIGVLYGTEEALAETPPWQGGGNMIADVTIERSLYQGPPNKFEAGTGNIADAVGLGEALRYVERVGIERIAAYEHALLEYATPRLADIAGVRLVGTADEKASVLSFVLAGHEPLEVGKALNAEGIAVRAGHHCAQPILRRLGLEATVRPSFAFYNTFDEIDVFIDAVRRIAEGGAPSSGG
ncbi:family 2A encapsulin nanocompartment cargo protein cysteine desulfurase [Mycolicibacterium sp. ELW1]|uniref:family 2A encapsulin nanocompartment cargo protein cysteine desulfurase n=1 Tax=Mycobacteriaceae TaxID=1762 RepID=UPI0011F02F51|nr:family 2A encapsulin nanocompartment cargo protein cysteine desulfurase [Mycobacterium sp. ELW1]QEN13683.1 SufS family cysteine desulfurase [Mycobacterium sp. ELW1]